MELITGIKERRSIRKFTDELLPEETVQEIVAAAAYAPSWKNTQITRYHLVQNPTLIQRIATEGTGGFAWNETIMGRAKNLMVISYVKGRSGFERDGSYTTVKGEQWQMFDAGIAAQTFCLAAHAHGVGTVLLGIFDENRIAEIVGLPENETVAVMMALGYPAETPNAPKRKEVSELLEILK